MPKTEKVQKVSELAERIRGSEAMFIADYRGLTVSEVTELRRSLRASGTKFTVAKNTLLKRAADEAGVEGLESLLAGPTAVAFVDGDPIAAAKGLVDALRQFRTLELRGGYVEGKVMSSEEAQKLATIEPREVLLAKIAGALKAEMSRAAYMFSALQSKFLSVLEAYKDKLPAAVESATEHAPESEASASESATTTESELGAAEPDSEPQPAVESAEADAEASTEAEAGAGTESEPETTTTDDASADASEPAESEGKE